MELQMKQVSLGPMFERLLGLSDHAIEDSSIPSLTEEQRKNLRMELQKALAAESVSDLAAADSISVISEAEKLYRISLKFTWSWPIPVALELQVIDRHKWIIEIEYSRKKI